MGTAHEDSQDRRPDVSGVRALAVLCQRAGVHDLEASNGSWSIRLRLDFEAADALPAEEAAAATASAPPEPHVLLSDWVGVFRRGMDPDEAMVQEGQQVREGEVIGLIEAMQLLHEQRADRAGAIVRFLVEDGAPVEFGQPLLEML